MVSIPWGSTSRISACESGLREAPLTQEDCGTHLYPSTPWKFTKTPVQLKLPPCRLGGDNEYVYKTLLKFSDEEYKKMDEWHIGMDYDPKIP